MSECEVCGEIVIKGGKALVCDGGST